jgi:AraC family ethanolamine operon transcriptional activator
MALIHLTHASRGGRPGTDAAPLQDVQSARQSRRELVERVLALLRENIQEPITVAEICRRVGVSERTLRAAFHDLIGLSPKQYAIAQRLHAVHDALAAASPGTTTVTDVAMAFGFFELGRFAGRYRDAFGEAPSRTLRQDTASWPEQAA